MIELAQKALEIFQAKNRYYITETSEVKNEIIASCLFQINNTLPVRLKLLEWRCLILWAVP